MRTIQQERILSLLQSRPGEWVALPEIMACAAQYNARIYELRHRGFNIENKTQTIDGQKHSWFKLGQEMVAAAPVFVKELF